MNKLRRIAVAASTVAALALAFPAAPATAAGNGAPSGSHFTLNIHGVPKGKTASMTGSDTHSMFVPLYGKATIKLTEGPFAVLDANGTDANGASFQLPNPDPTGSGTSTYSVYARALGKPGGKSTMTSCITDSTNATWCSTGNTVSVRNLGGSKFINVTKNLMTTCVDTDGNGTCDTTVPLFSDSTFQYSWQYDNQGLRLLQLRFYPVGTPLN